MKKFFKKKWGLSIAELLVAGSIFVIMMGVAGTSIFFVYQTRNKVRYTDELYTETRILMDRIIREIRVNTVDYGEYFLQNPLSEFPIFSTCQHATTPEYGKCAGLYEMLFYYVPNTSEAKNQAGTTDFSWKTEDRASDMKMGYFNTFADESEENDKNELFTLSPSIVLPSPSNTQAEQSELYLISSDGMEKTIIRKNDTEKSLEMLKMKLSDIIDSTTGQRKWEDHPDFDGNFIRITPPNIAVEQFSLFVSPQEDPYKGFAESIVSGVHNPLIQPHVIVKLGARISDETYRGLPGANNVFEIQTSASSRVFHDVTFPRP